MAVPWEAGPAARRRAGPQPHISHGGLLCVQAGIRPEKTKVSSCTTITRPQKICMPIFSSAAAENRKKGCGTTLAWHAWCCRMVLLTVRSFPCNIQLQLVAFHHNNMLSVIRPAKVVTGSDSRGLGGWRCSVPGCGVSMAPLSPGRFCPRNPIPSISHAYFELDSSQATLCASLTL